MTINELVKKLRGSRAGVGNVEVWVYDITLGSYMHIRDVELSTIHQGAASKKVIRLEVES